MTYFPKRRKNKSLTRKSLSCADHAVRQAVGKPAAATSEGSFTDSLGERRRKRKKEGTKRERKREIKKKGKRKKEKRVRVRKKERKMKEK